MYAPRGSVPYHIPVVVKDKHVRVYETDREAVYAAEQIGGVAYLLYTDAHNYISIDGAWLKRSKQLMRKFTKTLPKD